MNLRDLKYLVAVSEFRSFSKAAKHCATSQPTLSNQIKKLEEYLEIEIFERGTHYVRVTPIGERIVDIAKIVLENSDLIIQTARSSSRQDQQKLTLGGIPTLTNYIVPEYLFKLKQYYQSLKIQLVEDNSHALIQMLVHQELDVALLPLPVEHDALEGIKLFDDPFYVAVPDDHPFAVRDYITLEELASQPLLMLDDDQSLYTPLITALPSTQQDVLQPQQDDFHAASLETLRTMVKHGLGLTIIPSVAIHAQEDDIRYIPLGLSSPGRAIGLFWHKRHPNVDFFTRLAHIISYKPIF